MENKAVELNIQGIKCDNKECDFINNEVNVEDYNKWLNKPCPKCGQILLTDADYSNVKMLMELTKIANEDFIGIDYAKGSDKTVEMKIKMDGTGKMDFEKY